MAVVSVRRWLSVLFTPVDAASLGVFRMVFGASVAWEACSNLLNGWVEAHYVAPTIHFTYLYLDFIRPWPGQGMHIHHWLMTALAGLVAVGCWYRVTSVLLFLAYTYVFLLEQSVYMNHHYLICLLAFLLMLMPAERAYSIDRLRHPALPAAVPRWNVWILRFQLAVVYIFGAIAKFNPDWLRGEPMYSVLSAHLSAWPTLGPYVPAGFVAYAVAYGGIVSDAAIPLLLLFRSTFAVGFVLAVIFHGLNAIFLRIGVFSYLMIGAILIFLPPDWPRRWDRVLKGTVPLRLRMSTNGCTPRCAAKKRRLLGVIGKTLSEKTLKDRSPRVGPVFSGAVSRGCLGEHRQSHLGTSQLVAAVFIHLYVLAQILIPFRHLLYPGPVAWSEEGHRFAWRMMLRHKRSEVTITVTDPATGRVWTIDPAHDLTARQLAKLHTFPDILLQYVHHHRDRLRQQGIDPIITVQWLCSLNGGPAQPMVDPSVNLAAERRSLRPARWILPPAQ